MTKAEQKLKYELIGTIVQVALLIVEDGKDAVVADSFELDASIYPSVFSTGDEAVTKTLAGYGLQKLIQDRTSQVSESTAAKFEAMKAEGERLLGGVWRVLGERTSTPKADPILAQAIARLKGISVPQATAALSALDKETLKTMRENPAVVDVMNAIRKESQEAGSVDLTDLLGL